MEQRRLRLGDILDDYCPRERRLTNHAVVAMIEEDVKQTRCTTCDAEHVYKGGKVPRRRKKETPASLHKEVLAGLPDTEGSPILTEAPAAVAPADTHDARSPSRQSAEPARAAAEPAAATDVAAPAAPAAPTDGADEPDADVPEVEEGPVHRPLIRAQLPRTEGHKEERRLPEFTIRQAGRGGSNAHFRGGDSRTKQPRTGGQGANGGNAGNAGNHPHGGPRFAGSRPAGQGRGQGGRGPSPGFRGAGQPRQGGPKKRTR